MTVVTNVYISYECTQMKYYAFYACGTFSEISYITISINMAYSAIITMIH
jgi:hypothetical protein